MDQGDTFVFDFSDLRGNTHTLNWSVQRFGEALADLRRETEARGLP